jgi:hypothetical protein
MLMLIHRLLFGGLGILILLAVLIHIRKKSLTTEFSLLWLLAALFLLIQFLPINILSRLARLAHVQPLALVCIIFFLFVTAILFYYSVLLSRLSASPKKMIQKIAILEQELGQNRGNAGRPSQPRL